MILSTIYAKSDSEEKPELLYQGPCDDNRDTVIDIETITSVE